MTVSPASFDEEKDRFMVLAGQKWPIPDLGPRQLRHCRAALIEMNNRFLNAPESMKVGEFIKLSDEDYGRLILDPIYLALTRAHPDMKREEFLDMAAKDMELMLAWFRVRDASGLFQMVAPDETGAAAPAGDTPQGEAAAVEQQN